MDRFLKYKLDHWIFWVGTILFHSFTRIGLIDAAGFGQFLLEIIVRNSLMAVLIYVNLFLLIPAFAQKPKQLAYFFFLVLGLLLYAMAKNAHDVYLYGYVLDQPEKRHFFQPTFYNISIALFYVAFSIAIYLSKEWYFQKELIRKIEIERLNTELDYLKAQINPHFLFNSINTIYFQIDKQNTSARETLMTLSEMLRYQLYECNGKEIAIEKEVSYLKNYTGLQRARKNENYKITFSSSDAVANFAIAPLLLIPFVENAFKHVSHFSGQANEIAIQLDKNGNVFSLKVFNMKEEKATEPGGIGLKNVQRRLELLYPERHTLTLHATEETFEIKLELRLL